VYCIDFAMPLGAVNVSFWMLFGTCWFLLQDFSNCHALPQVSRLTKQLVACEVGREASQSLDGMEVPAFFWIIPFEDDESAQAVYNHLWL
jgi:hypothetical protein